jgi:hypothetical protein
MKRTPALVSILVAAAIALGSAGTASAHQPAPAADEQCGAQGDQTTEQLDDVDCGLMDDGQSGDQGETPGGQTGADEHGDTQTGAEATSGDTHAAQSGDQGMKANDQDGDQQEGSN